MTREEHVRRMMDGRNAARAAGRRVGGSAPYGWRVRHGDLVPIPGEQAVRWLIRHLRAQGWTLPRIADELTALGIAARNGGQWRPNAVQSVTRQPEDLADTG